jgi:hypothetical protein
MNRSLIVLCACAAHAGSVASSAELETPERPVDGISDNSFLIEEAYNQEAGVVQHILTFLHQTDFSAGGDLHAYDLAFTQEWPVISQTHQVSYTLPLSFVESNGDSVSGLGDIQLHYRFQAWFDERSLTAFSPRISVGLPTGDDDKGLGEDTVAWQINLPFSTTLGDAWFWHFNAGTTIVPRAASAARHDLWHYHVGTSLIHALSKDVHLMLEWVGTWDETRGLSGRRHTFSSVLLPGVRKAFNLPNGSQWVGGLGLPLGVAGDAPEIGAFFYLSFEHAFRKP